MSDLDADFTFDGAETGDVEEPAEIVDVEEVEASSDDEPEAPTHKPARRSTRKSTRKTVVVDEAPNEETTLPEGPDPSLADLRTSSVAHSDTDFVVVVNPNLNPVTANCRGQILAGYSRGVVSSGDPVSRRAIEKGLLLVPSGQ